MRVILREDYPSLGFVGDAVSVKGGYARNFLIPKGIALEVGSAKARQLAHILAGINAKKAKKKAESEALKERLEKLPLEFVLKLGEQGKSFGAVTAHDIELELQKQDILLDRKQIRLHEPIKSGGNFPVQVKLHSEVVATLAVKVNVETPVAAPKKEGEESRGKRERGARKGRIESGAKADTDGEPRAAKGKRRSEKSEEETDPSA